MKNRLRELRRTLSLSQAEFAKSIAMGQTGISMVENGTRELTDRQIVTICAVFGVDETWLRTGEGEPFPAPSPEDQALDDAFFALQVDDMDPVRKKLARAALELIAQLPEEAMPALRKFLHEANQSFEENKKDEL